MNLQECRALIAKGKRKEALMWLEQQPINADTLLGLKAWEPEWNRDNINVYKRPIQGLEYI